MANDLNRCEFIGRLGRTPELRYTQDGSAVANINLACGWKSGEKEGTEWIPVVVFGKLAEICGKYLDKGSQVYFSGRMRTRQYDKDGVTHYRTEVVATDMQMLGSKRDSGPDSAEPKRATPQAQKRNEPTEEFDDDIPFMRPISADGLCMPGDTGAWFGPHFSPWTLGKCHN